MKKYQDYLEKKINECEEKLKGRLFPKLRSKITGKKEAFEETLKFIKEQ